MRPCVEPEKRIPERSTNNHPPYFKLPTTRRASYCAWYSVSRPFRKSDGDLVNVTLSFVGAWCVDEVRWLRRPMVSAELLALVSGCYRCSQMPHGKFIPRLKIKIRSNCCKVTPMIPYRYFKSLSQIFEHRRMPRCLFGTLGDLYYPAKRGFIGSPFLSHIIELPRLLPCQWLKWISSYLYHDTCPCQTISSFGTWTIATSSLPNTHWQVNFLFRDNFMIKDAFHSFYLSMPWAGSERCCH
jgi:hypothetical protein